VNKSIDRCYGSFPGLVSGRRNEAVMRPVAASWSPWEHDAEGLTARRRVSSRQFITSVVVHFPHFIVGLPYLMVVGSVAQW